MLTASPITITRDGPRGAERVALVELPAVEQLISNYNAALDAPPHLKPSAINYARAFANLRLAQWGVAQ